GFGRLGSSTASSLICSFPHESVRPVRSGRQLSLLIRLKKGASMPREREQEKSRTRPVHEVRLGRIKAAVWENQTQNGTRHNVTLSRLYKDGDQWKDSASFGRDDLPLVM